MTNEQIPILKLEDYNNINKSGIYRMGTKLSYKYFQILNDLDSKEQIDYEKKCKSNSDFAFGAQITKEELDRQDDRGQYSIIINKVRKLIKSLTGIVTANKPRFASFPTHNDDHDTYVSMINNYILDWIWGNSKGIQTHRKVITRAIRDNIGYYMVEYSSDGKVRFIPLSYNDVRVQKNSKDSLFDDASIISYHKWIPVDFVKSFYNVDIINFESPPQEWGEYKDELGDEPKTGKFYSSDKNYIEINDCKRRIPVRNEDGNISYRIIRDHIIGIDHLYREVLPEDITYYNIIPVFSEDTENPWKLGEVEFLRGLQRFYNKAYGVIIHNAQLMSNPKVFVYEDTIPDGDITSFENNFSIPGSVNVIRRTTMSASGGASDIPVVVGGQPINTAFYQLKVDIDREFEEATLPKQLMGMGDTTNQIRNISRLDMLENVLDSYKVLTGNIDESLSRLGVVCLQYFKAYVNDQRVLEITNSNNKIKRLRINQKRRLDVNNPRSIAEYQQSQLQKGRHPIDVENDIAQAKDDSETIKALEYVLNSTKDMSCDIQVIPKSYAPTYDLAKLTLMMELKQMGVVDNEAVIENIPYEDRKKLIKRLSQVKQLQNQTLQLQETIEEMEKTINKFKQLFTKQEIDMIKKEAELDQKYITKDMRVKAYLQKVLIKMKTKEILSETELKAKEMIIEFREMLKNENKNQAGSKQIGLMDLVNESQGERNA